MRYFRAIEKFISWIFWKKKSREIVRSPALVVRKKTPDAEHFENGVLQSLPKLLNDLPKYFEVMQAIKRENVEDYKYFSTVGAQITGNALVNMEMPISWKEGYRPSAAMIYLHGGEWNSDDLLTCSAVSFKRIKWIEGVEVPKKTEDLYLISSYLYDHKKKRIFCVPIPIAVGPGAELRVLRQKYPNGWKINDSIRWLGVADGEKKLSLSDAVATVEKFFRFTANLYTFSGDGILTSCYDEKKGVWATFNIPMTRAPYFFRDRVKVKGETGRTAKIFHSVRPHERLMASGEKTNIKFHFRGLRSFNWNGYKVQVSVPGWHHKDLRNLEASAHIHAGGKIPKGMISDMKLAKELRRHISVSNAHKGHFYH